MATAAEQTGGTTQTCIDQCSKCRDVCSETLAWSIRQGGALADGEHLRQLLDCIQMCTLTHDFMLRQSPHHAAACGLCAEVCRACVETCERVGSDDEQIRRCIEACRRCTETCSAMAA
jgi:hypothetical protein